MKTRSLKYNKRGDRIKCYARLMYAIHRKHESVSMANRANR